MALSLALACTGQTEHQPQMATFARNVTLRPYSEHFTRLPASILVVRQRLMGIHTWLSEYQRRLLAMTIKDIVVPYRSSMLHHCAAGFTVLNFEWISNLLVCNTSSMEKSPQIAIELKLKAYKSLGSK